MLGFLSTKKIFIEQSTDLILQELRNTYPTAELSQIQSWQTLINDLKQSSVFLSLPDNVVVGIEYSLPTGGMGIDLIICGYDINRSKKAFIIESKQWNDQYIEKLSFSEYREEGKELHPQIQVGRHHLSFKDYTDVGFDYDVNSFVYIRNCGNKGLQIIQESNPRIETKKIPITNKIDDVLVVVKNSIVDGNDNLIEELKNAEYKPSKDIIDAMKSIITKVSPFILTPEQEKIVKEVKKNIKDGKRVIRITGAAGSGKTAILLNLYVELLNEKEHSMVRPIFVSGAQNTAYYRDLYPEVQNSFEYSFSLERDVAKTKGNLYVILMDEAQHNQPGIITKMIDRGATLIICYDVSQVINANNAINELKSLESRSDFISLNLEDSIRYNGSKVAEKNIRNYLKGGKEFIEDPLFDFKTFDDFESFQNSIQQLIKDNPNKTVAVAGLLSNDSKDYTNENNPSSKLFTNWGNKEECRWMKYIREKDYLNKNDGNLWVGTWWLPGLDVDYISVIVGGDATLTSNGLVANPREAKHYRMIVSIAQEMNLPTSLIVEKNSFGKMVTDFRKSTNNIIDYLDKPENNQLKEKFNNLFSKLLRNNYYIMMSRGRKGCYVYFAKNENKN